MPVVLVQVGSDGARVLNVPRFMIMGKYVDRDGDCVVKELFAWCGDQYSGIYQAEQEAPIHGVKLIQCWAVSIN